MKGFLFFILFTLIFSVAGRSQTTLVSGDVAVIYHLSEKNSKISLEFEDGRRKAAKIFSKIKVECIQRRNL